LHASRISRLSTLIIHRVTDCEKPRFGASYVFGRTLREGIRLSNGHVNVTKPEVLRSHPENLVRIFDDAQKYGCRLSHEARELLRGHLDLVDDDFRRSAEANTPFFSILKWKDAVYETLADMHRSGVLGAFIPEFGRLLCMVLHDAYHIYTVDQHSLHLVKEIEQLRAGIYAEGLPQLTQLGREAEKIELLYLGMMFHDIGKGFGGGHSEVGARMVRPIARRMRLNADDGALVEFLVRHHLLMTNTAFRRDLEDQKTIFDFARTMGSVNNLKMLYLLTFADVKAVGPEVWNPWKASLLAELYVKTLNLLEEAEKGEFERPDVLAERDCTSVVICCQDRPGLFASITGVFTALQLDILNARIFTASDGRILDVFRISHHGRSEIVMGEQKWIKFRLALEGILDGKIEVAALVASSMPSQFLKKSVPKVATVVNIDNEASDDFTIIEVFTEDRIGVLFTITYSLHCLGLSIHVAKISTNVDQVADVFYVTDERGGKITDAGAVESVREFLRQNLVPQNESSERRAEPLH
jgi:[protein-PII] uridylyltransferase